MLSTSVWSRLNGEGRFSAPLAAPSAWLSITLRSPNYAVAASGCHAWTSSFCGLSEMVSSFCGEKLALESPPIALPRSALLIIVILRRCSLAMDSSWFLCWKARMAYVPAEATA